MAERSYGAFSHSVELPAGVGPEDVTASLAKGVLTVAVPKPAQAKQITIKPPPDQGPPIPVPAATGWRATLSRRRSGLPVGHPCLSLLP